MAPLPGVRVKVLGAWGARAAGVRLRSRVAASARGPVAGLYDGDREERAERRAQALLRSCVDADDWAMYRELGFIRVPGRLTPHAGAGASETSGASGYAYLIYPHKPIVAYIPSDSRLLGEYCVAFPDPERPYGSERLPPSDDVLAKWLALAADERQLITAANLDRAGRQLDPARLGRDLERLRAWEHRRRVRADQPLGSAPTR
jgi:hypothetical protein